MKTYFIKAGRNVREIHESLKRAVLEYTGVAEYDTVFALSYDREDQFFLKTREAILWGRVFTAPATYKDIPELGKEIQKLSSVFNLPVQPFVFFQDLSSGHGLLKALPGHPHCFEYSFLKSESGSALALKDLLQSSPQVVPPGGPEAPSRASSALSLSRSEISELIDISLNFKRL